MLVSPAHGGRQLFRSMHGRTGRRLRYTSYALHGSSPCSRRFAVSRDAATNMSKRRCFVAYDATRRMSQESSPVRTRDRLGVPARSSWKFNVLRWPQWYRGLEDGAAGMSERGTRTRTATPCRTEYDDRRRQRATDKTSLVLPELRSTGTGRPVHLTVIRVTGLRGWRNRPALFPGRLS